MKLIDADKGYEVLDRLLAAVQKNNYAATQQMLDDAWEEWCAIPAAYDVDKVMERLKERQNLIEDELSAAESRIRVDEIDAIKEIVKAGGVNEQGIADIV